MWDGREGRGGEAGGWTEGMSDSGNRGWALGGWATRPAAVRRSKGKVCDESRSRYRLELTKERELQPAWDSFPSQRTVRVGGKRLTAAKEGLVRRWPP